MRDWQPPDDTTWLWHAPDPPALPATSKSASFPSAAHASRRTQDGSNAHKERSPASRPPSRPSLFSAGSSRQSNAPARGRRVSFESSVASRSPHVSSSSVLSPIQENADVRRRSSLLEVPVSSRSSAPSSPSYSAPSEISHNSSRTPHSSGFHASRPASPTLLRAVAGGIDWAAIGL